MTRTNRSVSDEGDLVPDAVVKLVFDDVMSPAKAWRTHLGLTQDEVAKRIGVTQSAYAQLETSARLRKGSRENITKALGISSGQFDF
jgi:DNA-binding XRE family transcriptional regulator